MQAVIMAGGFGTRLRPLTMNIPKPMVPLMNRPLIGHIMHLLKQHNFTDIIVMLFFQPELIQGYLGDGSDFGAKITYLQPEVDLGTAGCVKFARNYINDTFLVISGDLLTDANLTEFYNFHKNLKGDATILLTKVQNPLPFGIIMTDSNHRITRFLEKPSWGEVFSDRINSGMYMLEPSILEKIPEDQEYDFSKNLFPKMLNEESTLLGFPDEGYWKDIGNLDEYLAVHQDCLSGKMSVHTEGNRKENVTFGSNTDISDSVEFAGTVVTGDNVKIEDEVYIQNSVIGDGTVIQKRARIINSVLWNNVQAGESSNIKNAVAASRVRIGRSSTVSNKVYIGEDVVIGDRSLIKPRVKIWPKKNIASDTILSTSLIWGDRWLKELFTDARISGIANFEITPEFAARLGCALGAFWGVGSAVYTSRDNDKTSFMVANAVQSGLISMGINLEDMRVTPIPVVRQVLRGSNKKGGLHIRRSPYDEQKIDIIVFDSNGLDLRTDKCKKVERLFFGEDYARVEHSAVGIMDYTARPYDIYRENFLEVLDKDVFKQTKMTVVVDFSFGPASTIFPALFSALNLDVVSLNAFLDPAYLTVSKKQRKEQVKRLRTIVKSLDADAGFIIDTTCERLFLVDNLGRYYENIELLAIITNLYFRHYKPQYIAAPVSAPLLIKQMANERGVGFITTKSSHRSMIETALKDGVGFVGGTRGGFIFTEFIFACDAMFAALKILEMMAKIKEPLSNLVDPIAFPSIAELDIACSWEEKGKVMNALMRETEGMKRDLIHGIKIFDTAGEDPHVCSNWILFLPAKEEALFNVTAEAPTKDAAGALVRKWAKKIEKWRDG